MKLLKYIIGIFTIVSLASCGFVDQVVDSNISLIPDAEDLITAIEKYEENQALSGEYSISQVVNTTITNLDNESDSTTITSNITQDVITEDNYIFTLSSINGGQYEVSFIDGSSGTFYQYFISNNIVDVSEIEEIEYVELFDVLPNNLDFSEIEFVDIEKHSETNYEVTINLSNFIEDTDLEEVFAEMGLDDIFAENIVLEFTFNESYTLYSIDFAIENVEIKGEGYKLTIESTTSLSIKDVEKYDLSNENLYWYLPTSLYSYQIYLEEGMMDMFYVHSAPSYLYVELERGYYSINDYANTGNYELSIHSIAGTNMIIDDVFDQLFIETEGTYYFKITPSGGEIHVNVSISNMNIQDMVHITDIPLQTGTITGNNENGVDRSYYTFENATQDGFIVFTPTQRIDEHFYLFAIDGSTSYGTCYIDMTDPCYIYVEQGEEKNFIAGGNLIGEFSFDYYFLPITLNPVLPENYLTIEEVTKENPLIIIDDDVAFIKITLDQNSTIEIVCDILYEENAYRNYSLYDTEGNLLVEHFYQSQVVEAGTYYLKVFIDDSEGILIINIYF